jgi:hypothetical protein
MNRKVFFRCWGQHFGALTRGQVEGLEDCLDSLEGHGYFTQPVFVARAAYALATIHHETGRAFIPVKERRGHPVKNPRLYALQNRYWNTGFYGRGLVQTTWEENYRRAGQLLKGRVFHLPGRTLVVDSETFVREPDLMLYHGPSFGSALACMELGLFARDKSGMGHSLMRYINKQGVDYVGARRIINGQDRAVDVANLAVKYLAILRGALES